MSHNPYLPPTTTVADFDHDAALVRPRPATIGVRLLWVVTILNLVGGVIAMVEQMRGLGGGEMVVFVMIFAGVFAAIIYGLLFWFLFAAGKGRNWARVTLTVLMVLSMIGWLFLSPSTSFRIAPVETTIAFVTLAIQIVAIVLLFVPASNAWYTANRR